MRTLRHLCLFCLGFALALAGLDRVLPPLERPSLRVKLERFAEEKDAYTALVVGSSQTFRGFSPALFDARLAAAGVRSKSFNLALPGAQMSETREYLRRVAELKPTGLRWVFIECDWVATLSSSGRYLTAKNLAWRSWESTSLLWSYLDELGEAPLELRAGAYWRSFVGMLYHEAGVARGVPLIEEALGVGVTELDRAKWLGPQLDGFQCLDDSPNEALRETRLVTREQKELAARQIRERLARRDQGGAVPSAARFFHSIEETVQAMGAAPVFFTVCGNSVRNELLALVRAGQQFHLLRFDDAERYPELFDVELRYDVLHYNREGARAFTTHFADAVLRGIGKVPQ